MKKALLIALLSGILVLLLVAMVGVVAVGGINMTGWRLSFAWSVPGNAQATRVIEQDLPTAAGQRVRIISPIGPVTVRGGADGQLKAEITAFGRTRDEAAQRAEEIVVAVRQRTDGWDIEVSFPRRIGWQGNSDRVALDISLPDDVRLDIDSKMGAVHVFDVTGDLDVNAAMGEVVVRDFAGDLSVRASMGRINVTQAVVTSRLDLDASMGEITFDGQPGQSNRVSASMGAIHLRFPPETVLQLDARVSMGSMSNDFPFQGQADGKSFSGQMGTGTPAGRLDVRASMGSIDIKGGR